MLFIFFLLYIFILHHSKRLYPDTAYLCKHQTLSLLALAKSNSEHCRKWHILWVCLWFQESCPRRTTAQLIFTLYEGKNWLKNQVHWFYTSWEVPCYKAAQKSSPFADAWSIWKTILFPPPSPTTPPLFFSGNEHSSQCVFSGMCML